MGLYINHRNAIRIQVPRDLHLGNQEYDGVQIGDQVEVELKRSKFAIQDTYILASGMFLRLHGAEAAEEESEAAEVESEVAEVESEAAEVESEAAEVESEVAEEESEAAEVESEAAEVESEAAEVESEAAEEESEEP
jgi:septal ring factor EnvC (AmiA/AmiB activator)